MIDTAKKPLYAAVFLMEIAYGLFLIVAGIRVAQAVESPLLLGILSPVHLLTRVLGNPYFGGLSDRLGRKRLIVTACVIVGLAFLLLVQANLVSTILAFFVCGLGNSIFWPSVESWIGQKSHGKALMRHLGVFGMAFTIGLGLGSLAGGILQKLAPPIGVIFACLVLAGVAVMISLAEDTKEVAASNRPISPEVPQDHDGKAADVNLVSRTYCTLGRIANFATWVTIGDLRFLFPKLCQEMRLSLVLPGEVNGFLYLCWFFMFFLLTRYNSWTYRPAPLLLFQCLGAAAALLMGLLPSPGIFFLAFGLFGFSAGMAYFSSMFYGQDGASDKGKKSGLHEMFLSLGALVGPLLGGVVAEFTGLRGAFFSAAAVIVIAGGIELGILRQTGRRETNCAGVSAHG